MTKLSNHDGNSPNLTSELTVVYVTGPLPGSRVSLKDLDTGQINWNSDSQIIRNRNAIFIRMNIA